MPTTAQLQKNLEWERKKTAFAWSKYYQEQEDRWASEHAQYTQLQQSATTDNSGLDPHLANLIKDLYEKAKIKVECPICLDTIDDKETLFTGKCGHNYHKDCINQWAEQADTPAQGKKCPTCRKKY